VRGWLVVLVAACASPVGTAEQAITNGAPDLADPAVLGLADELGQIGCTASLIDAHTAITAAHCIAGRDPRTLRALIGGSASDGSFEAIAHGETDPAFDPPTLAHDLALVTLRAAHADVLVLAAVDATLVGANVRAVGFGTTAADAMDGGVKRAGTAVVTEVQTDEVVTTPAPAQACHGDSGGPMILAAGTIGAVASRGDSACSDHATYARIDVARAAFVDPYLAATGPGTAMTGDACFYDGHCAGGPCLATHDDPTLFFCSRTCSKDADCPPAMQCASDGCRYPEPSPGALGAACGSDGACAGQLCRQDVCTKSCLGSGASCPAGFECQGSGLAFDCFAAPTSGCGGCATGGGAPAWLAIIALLGGGRGWSRRGRRGRSVS